MSGIPEIRIISFGGRRQEKSMQELLAGGTIAGVVVSSKGRNLAFLKTGNSRYRSK